MIRSLLASALFVAGCSSDRFISLNVRVVTAPESGGDVTQLELRVSTGEREVVRQLVEAKNAALVFPVEVQLRVPAGVTAVTVSARSAASEEVDRGESAIAPGATAVEVQLSRGSPPGRLSVAPAWTLMPATRVGEVSAPSMVAFTNVGYAASAPLALSLSGDVADFTLEGCSGEPIAAGATCNLDVRFHPTAAGRRRLDAGVFVVEGDGLEAATLAVRITGQAGDHVTFLDHDCAGDCTATVQAGTLVTLRAFAAEGSSFSGWSGGGCAGHADVCVISVAGMQSVTATFEVFARPVRVEVTGPGFVCTVGEVTERCCSETCTWWYPISARPTLWASPNGGNGLTSLSGDCASVQRDHCFVDVTAARTVAASFGELNYAFVTPAPIDGGISSLTAADAECMRQRPTGYPGTYRAWLSAPGQPAATRLDGAFGWQTRTRERFADDVDTLLRGAMDRAAGGTHRVYATGTLSDGGVGETCAGWTSTSTGTFTAGESTLSTIGWTDARTVSCTEPVYLLCLGVSYRSLPYFDPTVPTSQRVFLSRALVRGSSALADGTVACAAEATDAGLGSRPFRPVLSSSLKTMSEVLFPLHQSVRVDGVAVMTASTLIAPMNVSADGRERVGLEPMWFGGSGVDTGTYPEAGESCADWDGGTTGRAMLAARQGGSDFVQHTFLFPCDAGAHVICAEAP